MILIVLFRMPSNKLIKMKLKPYKILFKALKTIYYNQIIKVKTLKISIYNK